MSYSELVIASLAVVTGVQLYAKFRQLHKFTQKEMPLGLSSLVSGEEFAKALAGYLGYPNETVVCLCFLALWWSVSRIEETAFDLYRIFVIEERHGYNRQTLKLFVVDFCKSVAILACLQVPLIAVILWIINNCGEHFYLYLWGFVSVFIVIMMYIFPILIAPLFNKYTELEREPLRSKIYALASSLSFPLTKIFLVDGSKRSDHSNAYLYGFWNNKRIVLYDTLLSESKNMKDEEIISILAHELGHWKSHHVFQHLIVIEVHLFTLFYLFGLILHSPEFYTSFGFSADTSKFIGLVLFTMVLTPVDFILELLIVKFTRYHEFQADAFAKKIDYGAYLQTALTKIYTQNSGNMNPDSLYASMYFSHPHLTERLDALGYKAS